MGNSGFLVEEDGCPGKSRPRSPLDASSSGSAGLCVSLSHPLLPQPQVLFAPTSAAVLTAPVVAARRWLWRMDVLLAGRNSHDGEVKMQQINVDAF